MKELNFPDFKDEKEQKKNIITLDLARKENLLLNSEYGNDNNDKKCLKVNYLNNTRLLSRDQLIFEDSLSGFIMENCSVLIITLE